MKESWLYYDYLRRWWLFLLLGPVLGGLAGLGYYLQQYTPVEFIATGVFSTPNQIYTFDPGERPINRLGYYFTVSSPIKSTETAAVESLITLAYKLETETGRRFEIQNTKMEQRMETVWWKLVVLGSTSGAVLALASVFVLEDARNYLRYRQSDPPNT